MNPNSITQSQLAQTLNDGAYQLLDRRADLSDIGIQQLEVGGATVFDFAVDRTGTDEAGKLLAEVCFASLGEVRLAPGEHESGLDQVLVSTERPLHSCIGAQYAGWPLQNDDYFAMCSGPIRMLRGKEEILESYGLIGNSTIGVGILESAELPTESAVSKISESTGLAANRIVLCIAKTASLPGLTQVVARSVETTLHKLHEIGFDLNCLRKGMGRAPVPPVPPKDITALGWSNDAILYGAEVQLEVESEDDQISQMIERVPSCSSPEFGTPFLEIFKKFEYDFYKIDKMLFSPAKVEILNQKTGNRFLAGAIRNDILKESFEL